MTGRYIGELAKEVGLSAKTIRYYESMGLLAPAERTESGYRHYSDSDAERLRFIKGAKALGFTLAEIREIVALWDAGTRPCAHVSEMLNDKLHQLEARIRELSAFHAELAAYKARVDREAERSEAPCAHIAGAIAGSWHTEPPSDWHGGH